MKGKPFTQEQKDRIILTLKDSLELGFSRAKSCKMVGLAESTLSQWVSADESLRMKLENWENANNRIAMKNIQQALIMELDDEDKRKETTKWWAERRMKEDFSTRTETKNEVKITEINDEHKLKAMEALNNINL